MDVKQLVTTMNVKVLAGENNLDRQIEGGHVGDLLSFVMAHAKEGNIWLTIQGHINSVAVASLLGLSAIILTGDAPADTEMLKKATEEEIPVLSTPLDSFTFIQEMTKKQLI